MNTVFNINLPVALGADHAGFEYKEKTAIWLKNNGFTIKDFGTNSLDSVDYPDFAHPTAISVSTSEAAFGILFCGSANGVAITANKHQNIRAGLCWNNEVAALVRQHNNANIICIPSRFTTFQEVETMLTTFITTPFEGGRHANRVDKIAC